MEKEGFERAERWADRIQLFALVIVLAIISAAVWLATFFALSPFIQDFLVQSLLATSVSLALAGMILIWRHRLLIGYSLVFLCSGAAFISLAVLWNSIHATAFCIHAELVVLLLLLNSMRKRIDAFLRFWTTTSRILGLLILFSAPVAVCLILQSLAVDMATILYLALLVFSLYLIGIQYELRNPTLGILNILLLSFIFGTYASSWLPTAITSETLLVATAFSIAMGIGLLILSQVAKRLQNWLIRRGKSADYYGRYFADPESLTGDAQEGISKPDETSTPAEWIISTEAANALSACAMVEISIGIPWQFLWMAGTTDWASNPDFLLLMGPLALIFSLLVLAPSAVFLRLAERIRRETEAIAVRVIGFFVVFLAALTTFLWTVHFLWPLVLSVALSAVLFLVGITGLFRTIRRLWRNLWLSIVGSLRRIKAWILGHPVITGVACDLAMSVLVLFYFYPSLITLPGSFLSLGLAFAMPFTIIATVGALAFRRLQRRTLLLTIGWTSLLLLLGGFSFWNLHYILGNDILFSLLLSSLWLYGVVLLQLLGIRRAYLAPPYLVCAFSAFYLLLTTTFVPSELRSSVLISVSQIIAVPMLYKEYEIAAKAISNALGMAGRKLYAGLKYLARIALQFILYSWAIILVSLLITLNWFVLAPYLQYDLLLVAAWSIFLFLVLYLPVAGSREQSPGYLKPLGASLIACAVSVLTFLYLPHFDLATRILASAVALLLILSLTRSLFPDRIKPILYPALWIVLIALAALQVSYFSQAFLHWPASLLTGALVIGVGLLPLKVLEPLARYAGFGYLILVLPSAILLTYLLTFDLLLCLLVLVVAPIPVAYRQYIHGIRTAGAAFLLGLRIITVYLAIYIVVSSAILGILFSGIAVLFWLPSLFVYHSNPCLLQLTSFVVMSLILCLPALALRKNEYGRILSGVSIAVCILFGADLALALQLPDLVLSTLLLIIISSLLLALAAPLIDFTFTRNLAIAVLLCSIILLAIYVVPIDPVSKVLLSAFTISLITAFSVPEQIRKDTLSLLGTSAFSAFIFWNFYLFSSDILVSILGFFWTEALLVRFSIPKARSAAWIVFSVSSAILIAFLLVSYYPMNILLSCLALLELLVFEEKFAFIRTRSLNAYALVRACLICGIVFFSLSQLLIALSIAVTLESLLILSVLVASLTFYLSLSGSLTPLQKYLLSFAISLQISLLIFTLLWTTFQQPLITSVYVALFVTAPFFLFQSMRGPYTRSSWYVFVILAAGIAGFTWMLVASGVEAVLLLLTTSAFILSAGALYTPRGIKARRLAIIFTAASFLTMLEAIWLWASLSVLQLSQMIALVGASLIPLTSILFPALGVLEWDEFRGIWTSVSVIACIPLSCLLTAWDVFMMPLPPSLLLTAGTAFSSYSLFATPVIAYAEGRTGILKSERRFHIHWIPSVLGWGFLGAEIGLSLSGLLELAIGAGMLGSSLALFFLYSLMPDRSTRVFTATLLAFAASLAIIVWFFGVPLIDPPVLITLVILVVYAVSLPLTLAASIAALTWASIQFGRLLDAFVEVIRGIANFVERNIASFALAVPLVIGILVVWFLSLFEISPLLLGFNIRSALVLLSAFFLVVGGIYSLEGLVLDESVSDRLQYPSLGALAIGINGMLLSYLLPESMVSIILIENAVLLSASISMVCLGLLSYAYRKSSLGRRIFILLGFTLFLYVFTTLFWLVEASLLSSLWPSLLLFLAIEVPIFWEQVKSFLHHIADLGRFFATFLRKLGALIVDIFRKFGYYTWTFFSLVFVVVIGLLSRPFFSELIGTPPTGIFYEVPNFSIPLMILGLFSLLLAIVRRRVKSSFGIFSGMLSIVGLGISIVTLLFDIGHPYLSVFVAILGFCSSGLLVKGELELSPRWTKIFWVPMPLSLSALIFYFIGFEQLTLDAFSLAVLVSIFPSTTLYLLSTAFNWLDKKYREPLWLLLGLHSGATVYFLSYLAVSPPFSFLAGLYLAILTAVVVSSVVTFQKSRQLFYAFLFFSLTGFAYTSVLGSPLQSLSLAVAALLLFTSRYVKEIEAERPQLVYLRLAILLALICSIAAFVILSGLTMIFI
ncbi:MAG: hypothetical protein EAX95_07735 [Candidatus Thorarchaeota archaeon]|nr:hypothetical protein [Candidatus Thorarchaeota archaeon]